MSSGVKKCNVIFLGLFAVFSFLLILLPFLKAYGEDPVVPAAVRVGIVQQAGAVTFNTIGKYQLIDRSTGEILGTIGEGEQCSVKVEENLIKVTKNGETLGSFEGPVLVSAGEKQVSVLSAGGKTVKKELGDGLVVQGAGKTVRVNSALNRLQTAEGVKPVSSSDSLKLIALQNNGGVQRLRGSLELRLNKGNLTVINELPLEEYLCGVVPNEMPAGWPLEALKAQAVAARCYVLQQMGTYGSQGFDVLANQYSQVYRGYDSETSFTNRAVEETAGVVAVYQGKPIDAFYFSSSGGYTENSEDVWVDKLPYIRGKEDPFDQNTKYYGWEVTFTREQLEKLLAEKGMEWTAVKDIEVLEETAVGKRIKKLKLTGLDKNEQPVDWVLFNADKVRSAFGLKSSPLEVKKVFDENSELSQVTFMGSGLGHGLGMSQYGAFGMAREGYTFKDILQYYYTDIDIKSNYGL